jgi:hypothetical protein
MKAKILCYVDGAARRQRRLRPMLRTAVNPPIGTATVAAETAAPRRALRARWQRSPVTGRLEMCWQTTDAEGDPRSNFHPAAAEAGSHRVRARGSGA